jgi:Uma2 family endonuclease
MNALLSENFVLNKFTAIDFLTNERNKTILLTDISWEEYEMFLEDFEEKAGWHLAYDGGKLEIMPSLMEHETPSRTIDLLVWAYCEHFGLTLESAGSTTFRRKLKRKGVEPDACFFVQNAEKVIGQSETLDPENYPVPDVAVEIDVTHGSLDKFSIYAALEVPEIWLFDGKQLAFYELGGEKYHQISNSRALPKLSAEFLNDFLQISKKKGQFFAVKNFRKWLIEQK